MRVISTFFLLFGSLFLLNAQNYSIKSSVLLWVETSQSPPSITLRWTNEPEATSYTVFRKLKTSSSWGAVRATLSKDSTRYTDLMVEKDKAYEYRVIRNSTLVPGSGYVYASIGLPATVWNGSILLLIDSTVNRQLTNQINRLKTDLTNEGWSVLTYVPSAKASVVDIRTKIAELKQINRDLRSVFILGHVKVPYSGNFNPDAHPDHQGAWPADCYYADVDGLWTDLSVDNNAAGRVANRNVPGDGKFDQSILPSDVDLEVGRVDFYDMPALGKSEMELLGRYLDKNHLWRTGQIQAVQRGIVQDNFNFKDEAFGQNGMKNFSAFFGPANVTYGTYRDSLLKKSYLWSFGSGGGNYQGASGISTTADMAKDSLQSIFTFLFGSYFGDWDSPNNFLRAALASGTILTNAWAGRPHWTVHHMALGETIGYGMRISNNNSSTYTAGYSARGTHMGLMGDPSLRLHPWSGSSFLQLVESGPHIDLKWSKNPMATNGYTVYRRTEGNTQFDILVRNVKDTIYRDECLQPGFRYEYMVRGERLETSASGSYYNLSSGVYDTITKTQTVTPTADFSFTKDFEFIHLKSESKNTNSVQWIIGKDTLSANELDLVLDCKTNSVTICLIAQGACDLDQLCKTISYECSIPVITKVSIDSIRCNGLKGNIEIRDATGADPFTFHWNTGSMEPKLSNVGPGTYRVTITSAKNTSSEYLFEMIEPAPLQAQFTVRNANPGKADGGLENFKINGGTPPYQYQIAGGRIDSLAAGDYILGIQDANGCVSQVNFKIGVRTANEQVLGDVRFSLHPNPAEHFIHLGSDRALTDHYRLALIQANGKIIRELSNWTEHIDVSNLPSGWMSLKITDSKGHCIFLPFEKIAPR